jgi:hypothetical protein
MKNEIRKANTGTSQNDIYKKTKSTERLRGDL